jgi:hypothetical protein
LSDPRRLSCQHAPQEPFAQAIIRIDRVERSIQRICG